MVISKKYCRYRHLNTRVRIVWVEGVAAYRKLSGNCWKSKLALRVSSPDTSRNSIVVF